MSVLARDRRSVQDDLPPDGGLHKSIVAVTAATFSGALLLGTVALLISISLHEKPCAWNAPVAPSFECALAMLPEKEAQQ